MSNQEYLLIYSFLVQQGKMMKDLPLDKFIIKAENLDMHMFSKNQPEIIELGKAAVAFQKAYSTFSGR